MTYVSCVQFLLWAEDNIRCCVNTTKTSCRTVSDKMFLLLHFILYFTDLWVSHGYVVPLFWLVERNAYRHEGDYVGVSFIHNHPPPRAPPGICTKSLPLPWGFCIQAFARGGEDLLGQLPRGGLLSINDVCHVWKFFPGNFHYIYNGKNWRLTTLCCSEILYVCILENYSILEVKKLKSFF